MAVRQATRVMLALCRSHALGPGVPSHRTHNLIYYPNNGPAQRPAAWHRLGPPAVGAKVCPLQTPAARLFRLGPGTHRSALWPLQCGTIGLAAAMLATVLGPRRYVSGGRLRPP